MPEVSVVIPTYRRPELLHRCLEGLAEQTYGDDLEVLVVDDASGDSTPEVLRAAESWLPGLRWASQPRNRGPAAARNRAVSLGGAPTLLFLDDDIVPSPSLVTTHLELLRGQDPWAGTLGLTEWLPSLEVTPFMAWLDHTDLQFAYQTWLEPGPVLPPERAFYTCNITVSREAFTHVGGFDERFPYPAYEDTELAWRLGHAGYHLTYSPEAVAYHSRAIDLVSFCARTSFVMESAVLLRAARPEIPLTAASPRDGLRENALRKSLAVVSRVRPRLFGQDLRSRYYWTEIEHAMAVGLKRAGIQPGQPLP